MSKGRKVLCEKVLRCDNEAEIIEFFGRWTPFRAVVEATASYEWFVQLIEPLAKRVILAHPKKLRVIAETKNKTDRIDAHVLAEIPGIGHDSSILSAHAAVASLSSPGALPAFCAWPGDFRALQDSAYTQRLQPGSAEPLHRRGLGILAGRRGFSGRPLGIGAVRVAVAAASQPGASGQQATAGVFQEKRRWPNANTAKCSAVFR